MKQKSIKAMEKELASLEPQSTAHQLAQLALPHVHPEDPEELQELCNLALHPITADERKLRYDPFFHWEDELAFEESMVMTRRMLYRLYHPEKLTKKEVK
ncbi:MAG: hypothetical protein WCA10_10230 [Terracidiphilus sp.]